MKMTGGGIDRTWHRFSFASIDNKLKVAKTELSGRGKRKNELSEVMRGSGMDRCTKWRMELPALD